MIQMEFYCFICYYAISLLLLLFYMRGFVQERDVDAVRERESCYRPKQTVPTTPTNQLHAP